MNTTKHDAPKLFDFIKGLTSFKTQYDFNDPLVEKAYTPFMIERFLLSIEAFAPILGEYLKRSSTWSKRQHYYVLLNVLPRQSVYCKAPMKYAEITNTIAYLMREYRLSKIDAESVFNQLCEDDKDCLVGELDRTSECFSETI